MKGQSSIDHMLIRHEIKLEVVMKSILSRVGFILCVLVLFDSLLFAQETMKGSKKTIIKNKKTALDLFLKKIEPKELPKKGTTLLRRDKEAHKKFVTKMDEIEYELEKAEAPVYKAWLESIGLTNDEMKDIFKRKEKLIKDKRESFEFAYKEYSFYETPQKYPFEDYLDKLRLCKDVTVRVCQRMVCVDQPVPLTVDDVWVDSGSPGNFTVVRNYDRFKYDDHVYGYSTWNWTYHRHNVTHEGGINIRSSVELVEPAKVRQIGIIFEPLYGCFAQPDWPCANGVFGSGNDPFGLPPSWGRGKMWISFQVSIKVPGETWIRLLPDNRVLYKDTGKIESRIAQAHTYPPPRVLTLHENYPAGTQFLIETNLSYWIRGRGAEGNAYADYALEAKPFMNLEACSWEYPESVTIDID
ncbi:MAG: hypothetical protein JSV33_03650 [bacterium]|nr:MAG: hypothetical protein JSV33_03650 [bacterium]